MNLLEHYIKEVKSIEPYKSDWTEKLGKAFLKITLVTNCYGRIEERTIIESIDRWKEAKERGYFLW